MRPSPRQIQRQQPRQDFFVGQSGGVVGPTLGGGHGLVQRGVGALQPGRALVVQVGERALA